MICKHLYFNYLICVFGEVQIRVKSLRTLVSAFYKLQISVHLDRITQLMFQALYRVNYKLIIVHESETLI